jgi:hypothetical protein
VTKPNCVVLKPLGSPGCCKQRPMGDSGGSSEDLILIGMYTVKTASLRYQIGTRTSLGIGVEASHVSFWQRTCLCFVCLLRFCGRGNFEVAQQSGCHVTMAGCF